jgi:oligopeptidase B
MSTEKSLSPPVAKIIPKTTEIHGQTLIDNYSWLREKTNQEVIDYLEAENKYTQSVMESTKELQTQLYNEMLSRIKETDMEVPNKLDNFYYYSRTEKGKQYKIYCRKKDSLDNPEEILLNVNALAGDNKYCAIGILEISPDHSLMIYGVDFTGYEDYTLHVKNLNTDELIPDTILKVTYGLVWANDNKTFYYTKTDEAKRPSKIYRHTLGEEVSSDRLLYEETDNTFNVASYPTMDKNYLVIVSKSMNASEIRYLNKDQPFSDLELLYERKKDFEYYLEHRDGLFYITTNLDAINFKLVTVSATDPKITDWQELIPHDPEVYLYSLEIFKDHLVIYKRINGLKTISIYNFKTENTHMVSFKENLYTINYRSSELNLDYNSKLLRFEYSSLITPQSIFDYNMNTEQRELKKQEEIKGYDASHYDSKREIAITDDKKEIYISLVFKKGLDLSQSHPLFLGGYGSYGFSRDPNFSSARVSLLDRGIIVAIAHIRGGGEKGKPWYNDGKLLNKKNSFNDFIRSAENLIEKNYTSTDKLAIMGGSAGGLLMGAVVNMRPDLFHAVLADVPFVDVINTMLDESIPLTTQEFNEWGNPKKKEDFDYISTYSPYDNIEAKSYPIMLVTAGLNDPRVHYWEPAKYVAKLRTTKTDGNLLLLKTNMGAGHSGASGRYDYLKEIAFEYAFLLMQWDLKKT